MARAANTTEARISRYDEKHEKGLRGLLKKLFVPGFPRYLDFPYYGYSSEFLMEYSPVERDAAVEAEPIPTEEEVLEFFRHVIEKLSKRDNVVIVGRGSQMILADKPNTLHLRFMAPVADRIEQIMKEKGVVYPVAQKEVEAVDKQRAHYLQHHYDADWADAKHYNFVLNTSSMRPEQVAKVIITAIRDQENATRADGKVERWSESDQSTFSTFGSDVPPSDLRYNPRHWG